MANPGAERQWFLGTLISPTEIIEDGALGVEHGLITYAGPASGADRNPNDPVTTTEGFLTPGLIDLHIHGAGGHSLMDPTESSIAGVARTILEHGTTAFLATSMVHRDLEANDHLVMTSELCQTTQDRARILGIHLEGPFVNKARAGLIHRDKIWEPNVEDLKKIQKLSQGKLKMMTLAPELDGALPLLDVLKEDGGVGSLGHTDASFDHARAGFENGIAHVTHLYNAMAGLHHREPGALGAVLTDVKGTAELITDGVHVHPSLLKWTVQVLGVENITLITDALPAAGLPDGEYTFDGRPYTSKHGTAWSLEPETEGKLFGTTILMDESVRRAMRYMEVSFQEAILMGSLNPAKTLGEEKRYGCLEVGRVADFVVWSEDYQVQAVYLNGQQATGLEGASV